MTAATRSARARTGARVRDRGHDFERGFYNGMRVWLKPHGILRFAHAIETYALREMEAEKP